MVSHTDGRELRRIIIIILITSKYSSWKADMLGSGHGEL